MNKKFIIISLIALLLISAGTLFYVFHDGRRTIRKNYNKITIGMDLPQVEMILGPGTEITKGQVPRMGGSQTGVVLGTHFYRWTYKGICMVLGFNNGKVCDKWYWEPSL